ncbi:ABC transporter ATP-binding protein [Candidatus Viridilinea mediisalina]|uniref:ABC transporter ATP-binding protein/permease n=1 Tax=Candidatus Viridilinea mediisalina TaxID=2024553 RepID=A0A2A6RH54_9CHLR|nr:ABC transporter ATP-binding protein [Candidatus Viridilinea mediisalina]PDW02397.1 ABC transporter ATP-binding protein/permease [Candidatus Viridilinea mediisalina]
MVQTYRRMLQAAGAGAPHLRRTLTLLVIAAVAQGAAFACFYPLLRALLSPVPDPTTILMWLGALLLFAFGDLGLRWWAHAFDYNGPLVDITHDLRLRLGAQLRRIPLAELSRRRTGDLNNVLAGNVEEVVAPMGLVSSLVIRTIIVPLVAVLVTLFIDWRLALAMLVIFPLGVPIYRWIRTLAGAEMREGAEAHAQTASELVDYMQGLPVLRAVNQVGARAQRLQASLAQLRLVQTRFNLKSTWPTLIMASIVELGILVVLALGAWFVLGGTLDAAALAALLVVAVRFSEPVAILANITMIYDYMEAGFERIEALLALEALPVQRPPQTITRFDIQFEGVSFGYGNEPAILRDITFTAPAKSLTALVGPSGSGKTTITRLISRYADPQQGAIRIGGVDLRAVEPSDLMRHIAVVFQDVYLFDDTIRNNIRMAKPDASDAEVEEAAREANCHEFITRLPDGYATRVGDIGGALSGGERQRVSIARAILKDAPLVLLDEPTAALDTESEVAVQHAIDRLVRNKTVIVIAHRLSTVVGADQILVLDNGQIVERGGHAELLALEGKYAAMWAAQQRAKHWRLERSSAVWRT